MEQQDFDTRWFRMASWLWFHRGRDIHMKLFNGQTARYLGWRRADVEAREWYGPALCLLVEGEVTHGWDPATVTRYWVDPS